MDEDYIPDEALEDEDALEDADDEALEDEDVLEDADDEALDDEDAPEDAADDDEALDDEDVLEDTDDDEGLEDDENDDVPDDGESLDVSGGVADEGDHEADDEDTEFATVAEGATIEDARRKAVQQLRKVVPSVAEADVEFIVLEEGSRGGFFGRGKSRARVEARLRPAAAGAPAPAETDDGAAEAAERLGSFLERTLELMGIAAAVETAVTADGVRADVSGDDLGLLIGRHGSTIDALQYVAAIVVNGDRRQRRQVVVDAEGYRVRRESILRALAERTAQRAARDNTPIALKPMSAAERKVIHLYLKDHPRVETASEGNEPFRAVVVSPRRRA